RGGHEPRAVRGRLGLGQRRLPHRDARRRRRLPRRRDERDAPALLARAARDGLAGQPRAAVARRRPPRRALRAGARRRRRRRVGRARRGLLPRRNDRRPRGTDALCRRKGLDRGGRRVADDLGAGRRLAAGLADPRDARADDPRRGQHRASGQPGGGRAGEVRRTTGGAPMSKFATIEDAIEDIRAGRMIVVCDDEDRENEGDLTLAAQFATPEAINFMAKEGRGLICLALPPTRCDELGLDLMAAKNESPFETAFTVSVEARDGVTTGISAHDRARTIQVAIDPRSTPKDVVQPGHIFPLKAKAGGVLERAGQTEAAVDLARLAGLTPAGVICEVMKDDGTMARVPDLAEFCERHGMKMVTVADLIEYRRREDKLVKREVEVSMP